MATPKKILICKIGALGDVIFALPALGAIKAAFPDAEISWLVGRSCAPLLAGNPDLSQTLVVDDRALFSSNMGQRLKAVREMRVQLSYYDLILIAHRGLPFSLALLGHGRIVQLARTEGGIARLFATQVPIKPMSLHESLVIKSLVREGLRVIGAVGKEIPWKWHLDYLVGGATGEIDLPPSFVCIHVGGGKNAGVEFTLKRWPHWPMLLRLLAEDKKNIVLVGAPNETEVAEEIVNVLEEETRLRISDYVGKTSLAQLCSVIAKADLFIGADSGPLHIADALGVPCIGLYGATSMVSWGLLNETARALSVNVPCSPCYKDDGQFPPCVFHLRCMKQLSSKMVMSAAQELLNGEYTAL